MWTVQKDHLYFVTVQLMQTPSASTFMVILMQPQEATLQFYSLLQHQRAGFKGHLDSPMKPKMSLMVGTKMTSMLLKARMAAAISM